jgi:hypothetical protein
LFPISPRHIPTLIACLVTLSTVATGQIVRQASWSIQDPAQGLRQELAETVIAHADEWLTREDPNAPIARLGDRVRVTVVDEIDPTNGSVRSRLAQLVLGTIVIDSSFREFLDATTIDALVRRDHFWRDESIVEFTGAGEPARLRSARDLAQEIPTSLPQEAPRIRIGLDESSLRITERVRLFEALGYEMVALPGTSYGRLRTGVQYDRLKMWAEIPLPLGTSATPAIGRTLESTFGAGLSFDAEHFSGAITWSDPRSTVGSPARESDSLFALTRTALFTWTIPLREVIGSDALVLRVGGGYQQFVPIVAIGEGRRDGDAIDLPKILVRGEYSMTVDGELRRTAAAEIFGTSVLLSYHEQFSRLLGIRIVGAVHGLVGDRPSYLPAYSVLITPTISIW